MNGPPRSIPGIAGSGVDSGALIMVAAGASSPLAVESEEISSSSSISCSIVLLFSWALMTSPIPNPTIRNMIPRMISFFFMVAPL